MKRDICLLFVFFLFVFFFSYPFAMANLPLSNKVFILDAGHGGVDPGSVVGSVYEKDINLKITQRLKQELQSLGAKVYMVRNADYDLSVPGAYMRKKSDFDHRILMINQSGADYYLSIHLNYLQDVSQEGPQVFYSNVVKENKSIAEKLQKDLNKELGGDREFKRIPSKIYMYQKLKIKGVLIECGFLSNSKERKKLMQDEYISELSMSIAKSFVNI